MAKYLTELKSLVSSYAPLATAVLLYAVPPGFPKEIEVSLGTRHFPTEQAVKKNDYCVYILSRLYVN